MRFQKTIVKNTGYSYVEVLYALLLTMNLFVLLTQIFYNINITKDIERGKRYTEYEVVLVRMEHQLKEATDLTVNLNQISFFYRDHFYQYYVFNNKFIVKIDYRETIYYLYNLKQVKFNLGNHIVSISFFTLDEDVYESSVLIP